MRHVGWRALAPKQEAVRSLLELDADEVRASASVAGRDAQRSQLAPDLDHRLAGIVAVVGVVSRSQSGAADRVVRTISSVDAIVQESGDVRIQVGWPSGLGRYDDWLSNNRNSIGISSSGWLASFARRLALGACRVQQGFDDAQVVAIDCKEFWLLDIIEGALQLVSLCQLVKLGY